MQDDSKTIVITQGKAGESRGYMDGCGLRTSIPDVEQESKSKKVCPSPRIVGELHQTPVEDRGEQNMARHQNHQREKDSPSGPIHNTLQPHKDLTNETRPEDETRE